MKAAVLYEPYDLRIEDCPPPKPKPGWVVIAVEAAGICGTDVAVYRGEHEAELPRIMGHEFAGRILSVGEGVSDWVEGQRVMAEGSWSVDDQASSKIGASSQALGRTVDGCFAEAVTVPAKTVHHLPPSVSARAAQSATTVATAVHAVDRAGDLNGTRVAIVGPGHAGLLLLQTCIASGAQEVTVLGTRDNRLNLARSVGASSVANVRDPRFESWCQDVVKNPFDLVFQASGTASGLALSFELVRDRGCIISYGIIDSPLDCVPGNPLYTKELTVIAASGAADCYGAAIELMATGDIDVESLISHTLPLEDAAKGFEIVVNRLQNVMRVVFTPVD